MARVYVVLLNWNGAADTIMCLESLLRQRDVDCELVVCDNASTDDSIQRLRDWSQGSLQAEVPPGDLSKLVSPAVAKPVRMVEYDRAQAERGGTAGDAADVYLLHTGANLGFAGGCNVGIRFALARGDASHVWLLNNDTVVEPDALSALVAAADKDPSIGIVGSTLRFFGEPAKVQAYGGATFDPWRAATRHIGDCEPYRLLDDEEAAGVESRMAYVVGASMLVTRAFLEQVGPMQDDYFLYYEEIDWSERAKRAPRPFRLAFAPRSIVYHKVGASAGTHTRSLLSVRYLARNRLRFMKRFYPAYLPLARLRLAWEGVKQLLKGHADAASVMLRAAFSPVDV